MWLITGFILNVFFSVILCGDLARLDVLNNYARTLLISLVGLNIYFYFLLLN